MMRIHVLIDPIGSNGYRASGSPPFPFTAEGATPQEAVQKLKGMIQERLKGGAVIVPLDIPVREDSLAQFAGMWQPNDPLLQEWQQAVEEYRRQVEQDPSYL